MLLIKDVEREESMASGAEKGSSIISMIGEIQIFEHEN